MAASDTPADVLIIGAGATGALAALVLARAGLEVVCLEQGGWVEPEDHPHYSADWEWQRQHPLERRRQHPPPPRRLSGRSRTPRRC